MGEEFQVVYDRESRCNCGACPFSGRHLETDIVYGTAESREDCERPMRKAYGVDGAQNVRIQKRTVSDWEEVF